MARKCASHLLNVPHDAGAGEAAKDQRADPKVDVAQAVVVPIFEASARQLGRIGFQNHSEEMIGLNALVLTVPTDLQRDLKGHSTQRNDAIEMNTKKGNQDLLPTEFGIRVQSVPKVPLPKTPKDAKIVRLLKNELDAAIGPLVSALGEVIDMGPVRRRALEASLGIATDNPNR
jgi:hypothetical protein